LAKSIIEGEEEEVRNALKAFGAEENCLFNNINVQKIQEIFKGAKQI
jgi:hypothetical protein